MHSLSALRAGAAEVVSLDLDTAATRLLRERAGSPSNWHVHTVDVLDAEAMAQFAGGFDVVYSFGVLHHTGHLWRAVDAAVTPLAPGGVLYVAIGASEVFLESEQYVRRGRGQQEGQRRGETATSRQRFSGSMKSGCRGVACPSH